MITVERLPDEDFELLGKIEEGFIPNPKASIAVVAKSERKIIGRLLIVAAAHVEAAWIDPHYRNGNLLDRMTKEIEKQARENGIKTVFVYSQTLEMDGYIERLGYERSPLRVFRKDL